MAKVACRRGYRLRPAGGVAVADSGGARLVAGGAATRTTTYTPATPTLATPFQSEQLHHDGWSDVRPLERVPRRHLGIELHLQTRRAPSCTSPKPSPTRRHIPGGPTTTGASPISPWYRRRQRDRRARTRAASWVHQGRSTTTAGTGSNTTESARHGVPPDPAGATLPLAPAYFPHIVRNSDGSLTGYFDYRPKDADEALMAATSTDDGKDWTYAGEALEQNPGYCPRADTNDDGEGHANVITVGRQHLPLHAGRGRPETCRGSAWSSTDLPTETNPLSGLPASEPHRASTLMPSPPLPPRSRATSTHHCRHLDRHGQFANAVDGDQLGQRVLRRLEQFRLAGARRCHRLHGHDGDRAHHLHLALPRTRSIRAT